MAVPLPALVATVQAAGRAQPAVATQHRQHGACAISSHGIVPSAARYAANTRRFAVSAFESFVAMRGDLRRTWVRLSDLQDAAQKVCGRRWSAYEVRLAIAGLPKPERKWHGHWHYTSEHMAAVEAAARMESGVMEGVA